MLEQLGKIDSLPSLIAALCVIGAFQVLLKVGEFIWSILQKKADLSEAGVQKLTSALQANTQSVQKLEQRLVDIEKDLAGLPKFRKDIRRAFQAVKMMAGEEWESIRKVIMDDSIDN